MTDWPHHCSKVWLLHSFTGYCAMAPHFIQGKGSNPYHSPQRPLQDPVLLCYFSVLSLNSSPFAHSTPVYLLVSTHFKILHQPFPWSEKIFPGIFLIPLSPSNLLRSYPLREALLIILFITMRLTHSLSGPPVNLPCTYSFSYGLHQLSHTYLYHRHL